MVITTSTQVLGVVRGRTEHGPRALGQRSLLGYPGDRRMREKLNRVKARQFYRPVAPVTCEEATPALFGKPVLSPFMSFALTLLPAVQRTLPAATHLDGTVGPRLLYPISRPAAGDGWHTQR